MISLLTLQFLFNIQYGHNISNFSSNTSSVNNNCNCSEPNPSPGPTPKTSNEPTFIGGDTGTTYRSNHE